MSTLQNRTFLLTLSVVICLSSCGQKVSHKEALDYCVQIQLQMKDAKANLEQSWTELGTNIKIAKQNPNLKLDSIVLDTLKKHYEKVMLQLDNNIRIVNSIKETDAEINFKQKTLECLTQIKTLQETAMPQMFTLLQNGLNTLTEQQKEENKKIPLLRQAVQQKNAEGQQLYLDYLKKYEIKDSELKQFGLAY